VQESARLGAISHFPTSFPHFGPGGNARDRSSANVVSFPTTGTIEANSDVVSASFSAQVLRLDVSLERLFAVCLIIAYVLGIDYAIVMRYYSATLPEGNFSTSILIFTRIPRRCIPINLFALNVFKSLLYSRTRHRKRDSVSGAGILIRFKENNEPRQTEPRARGLVIE